MDTIGVSQTDFLSGEISMTFDLEKARAVCKTLPKYMNGACPCKEEAEAAKMLIKALPEIRRLQEFRDRVARILKQPLTDCDDLLILGLDARICQLRRQAAEIERLRADLEQSEICIRARLEVIEQLQAENEELQESLTDAYLLGSHKKAKELAPRIKALEDALKSESKIGPDATKPRSWQITEERKETLRRALEEYKIFPNDQAVLRAMLTEAE